MVGPNFRVGKKIGCGNFGELRLGVLNQTITPYLYTHCNYRLFIESSITYMCLSCLVECRRAFGLL